MEIVVVIGSQKLGLDPDLDSINQCRGSGSDRIPIILQDPARYQF
jgi:hypothetical protein